MTNRLILGLKTGQIKTRPYTPAQEAEKLHREAVDKKQREFKAQALARVKALVPLWSSLQTVRANSELELLDTPQKALAGRICQYADRCHKKMRHMPTAGINGTIASTPDPFGDGKGWPV